MFQQPPVRIGVDASSDTKYVAVVVGWQADIDQLHRTICARLGLTAIHMRELAAKARKAVIEEICLADPSRQSIRMHCFTVEKQSHLKLVLRKKPEYGATHRLYDSVDYCIGIEVTRAVYDSLLFFEVHWSEISTEVDDDTERILKQAGMAVKPVGPAHQLADAVAWSNHKSISLPNLQHADLESRIGSRLRKRLKL